MSEPGTALCRRSARPHLKPLTMLLRGSPFPFWPCCCTSARQTKICRDALGCLRTSFALASGLAVAAIRVAGATERCITAPTGGNGRCDWLLLPSPKRWRDKNGRRSVYIGDTKCSEVSHVLKLAGHGLTPQLLCSKKDEHFHTPVARPPSCPSPRHSDLSQR